MKVAFVAWENCSVEDVAPALMMFRQADAAIRTLTIGGIPVHASCALRLLPDAALEHVNPRDFDVLLMSHGGVTDELLSDHRLLRFARQLNGSPNAWLAASGASCAVLGAAGLLGGIKFTSPADTLNEHRDLFQHAAYVGGPVCLDANVITSNAKDPSDFTRVLCVRLGISAAT